MSDQLTVNRRRVLELSGVGTGLAIAGCMDSSGTDFEGDRGELEDDERRVTMALEIDQEQIQQRQQELLQQVEDEEISQEDAQAELQELQQQLIDEAFDSLEDAFADLDLTIEDRLTEEQPLMLVAGPATDLIDALEAEVIQVLGSESLFDEIQQAQDQPPVEEEPVEEEPVEE